MQDLDTDAWLDTAVPSSIFHSLVDAGKITQADIDANPENLTWVSEKPWVFSKTFDAPADLLAHERIDLAFDGLDTVATVWLNEKLIGKTANMFIPHRFNVSGLLKQKYNRLVVKFDPARAHAEKLMQRYGVFTEEQFRNPSRVYIRKAQYQFGWDWCPSLDGCGIWRACRLEGITNARLEDVHIRTIDANQHYADIRIAVKLDRIADSDFSCRLTLSGGTLHLAHEIQFKKGQDFQSAIMRIDRPFLWWPKGYGVQHLYTIDAELFTDDTLIDRSEHKIGVRTIKLIRADANGPTFQFEINGQPIYIKGADWIPAALAPGRVAATDYEQLIKMAADAHINMLRVWGGGYYENPAFYQTCDRLGILVWQDFMFACAYYPDHQWFLDEITTEATAVIKQLRNYACLALWCGNNENNWLHKIGALGGGKKFYGKDIYHKLLPPIISELDPGTDYIPSTPHYNKPADRQQIAVHQWNVWSGHAPIRDYIKPPNQVERFVTEFGFASMPCTETIKKFAPAEALYIGSRELEKYNYQIDGNGRLFRYLGDMFATANDLDDFAYKTQITQARAVKLYIEYLRANKSRNHGAMYWQFADCCPAISWSAVDYLRQPKALYYYTRRFYAPLLVTAVPQYVKTKHDLPPQLQSLHLVVINDTAQSVTASLAAQLLDIDGTMLDQTSLPMTVSPHSTSTPLKLSKHFVSPADPDNAILHITLAKDEKLLAENVFQYVPDKYLNRPDSRIQYQLRRDSDTQWKLALTCQTPAKDVRISTAVPAILSDNFFDMFPCRTYEVTITTTHPLTDIPNLITIRSTANA